MHTVLKQQYSRRKILITNDPRNPVFGASKDIDPAQYCQKFDLILGHCPVGIHEVLDEVNYISCVRNPIKRLVSHYHYARQLPNHYLYNQLNQKGFGFKDYVESDMSSEISNGMIRMLCGRPDFKKCQIDDSVFEETVSLAKERFRFIATTERFDECMLILQKELGLTTPYYARKKVGNYTQSQLELTPDIVAIMRERNKYDQLLYELIDDEVTRKSEQYGITVDLVNDFKIKNQKFGKWIHLARELKGRLTLGNPVNGSTPEGMSVSGKS